jgi:hypothetical protein
MEAAESAVSVGGSEERAAQGSRLLRRPCLLQSWTPFQPVAIGGVKARPAGGSGGSVPKGLLFAR